MRGKQKGKIALSLKGFRWSNHQEANRSFPLIVIISCFYYCLQGHLEDVQNFHNSSDSQLLFLSCRLFLYHVLGQLFDDK